MDRLLRTSQASSSERNHTQDSVKLAENLIVDVKAADYVEGYKLRVVFSDGYERIIDFSEFLHTSLNPMIRKYLNLTAFKNFSIKYGDLFWDDYDLCFPVASLYEGQI